MSFVSSHPGRQLFDTIEVEVGGRKWPVKLFPPHCVAGSPGAELAGGRAGAQLQRPCPRHVLSFDWVLLPSCMAECNVSLLIKARSAIDPAVVARFPARCPLCRGVRAAARAAHRAQGVAARC